MKRINLLDQNTANKIAAGEVVERPSSIVKELAENSIDANSTKITIEISDGGSSLIKVIDNGTGIYADDIEKAFMPHATSKISNADDIFNINSLGFRGEALPSIAAISKIILRSKTLESEYGKEISIEGGVKNYLTDSGISEGTYIEVRDIFFNVPARKKFLKTMSRESSLINDIVTRIAISNPSIAISLFNNGKNLLSTYGTGNIKDVIRSIYGKSIYDNVISFEGSFEDNKVFGFVGNEDIAKGSRNNQSIFVNGRYIKNKSIVVAVENAFKSFSVINKFPFFVLFIEVPSENIDINIHPTKAEIKFIDEKLIFKLVFNAIHSALRQQAISKFSETTESNKVSLEKAHELSFDFSKENTAVKYNDSNIYLQNEDNIIVKDEDKSNLDIKNIYDSIHEDDVKREEEIFNTLKNLNFNKSSLNQNNVTETKEEYNCEDKPFNFEKNNINKIKEIEPIAKFSNLRIIGQFKKMYILAEYNDDLYIIDQHAAHEKILFEKYIKQIENHNLIVQPVLIPTIIDLSLNDFSYYEENKTVFENAGFKIESFGGTTISIKEVPYFLGKIDATKLFNDILLNLKNLGTGKTLEVKLNKIASMACRSAIKANDYLNINEMEKLINDLRFIDDPFHCPHGRPIILKFSEYELNKKFRRII